MSALHPRYPVYVPSKGRYEKDSALTIQALQRDGVPFRVVVEEPEREKYARIAGEENLLILPFVNKGLIASRNFCREHATKEGHARHWQLDDNIIEFRRLWRGQRIPCDGGTALRVCEDLTDRYSNVGVSGLNYQMFVPADMATPFYRNVHVYSCSLINHEMPFTWRLAYNDDTDICLQALSNGWATLLVSAFMANKLQTMVLKGGNTSGGGDDGVKYAEGFEDHSQGKTDSHGRFEMAQVLADWWPGLVKIGRRFNRYQHTVNWGKFANDPKLRVADGVDLDALPEVDEFGLTLRKVKTPESPMLRKLAETYGDDIATTPAPEGWRGLPAFEAVPQPPKRKILHQTEEDQETFIKKEMKATIAKRTGPALSVWYPPRPRQDLSSLRFDGGPVAPYHADRPPIMEVPVEPTVTVTYAEPEDIVREPASDFAPIPEPDEKLEAVDLAEHEDRPILRPSFGAAPKRPSGYDPFDSFTP